MYDDDMTMTTDEETLHPRWRIEDLGIDFETAFGGVKELAGDLGVDAAQISTWSRRWEANGFPEEVALYAMGPVYDRAEVKAWFAGYEPSKIRVAYRRGR